MIILGHADLIKKDTLSFIKKNYPNINIIIPKMVDSPIKKIQWGTNLNNIKVIFYEYISLINNKLKY